MRQFLLVLTLPALALAFSSGPPDARTGAPGEGNCTQCHNTFALNSGAADFFITGPSEWVGGETYPITVTLLEEDPTFSRWGFELTPRGIGTISITDPIRTQLSDPAGMQYVKHTSAGTDMGTFGGNSWTFDWTAPLDLEFFAVTFYAAGNTANQNFSNSGDYIYTTSLTIFRGFGPPPAIEDLSIIATGTDMQLSWSAVPEAMVYNIYRSLDAYSGYTQIGVTGSTTFDLDESGVPGAYYYVTAEMLIGLE